MSHTDTPIILPSLADTLKRRVAPDSLTFSHFFQLQEDARTRGKKQYFKVRVNQGWGEGIRMSLYQSLNVGASIWLKAGVWAPLVSPLSGPVIWTETAGSLSPLEWLLRARGHSQPCQTWHLSGEERQQSEGSFPALFLGFRRHWRVGKPKWNDYLGWSNYSTQMIICRF